MLGINIVVALVGPVRQTENQVGIELMNFTSVCFSQSRDVAVTILHFFGSVY